MQQVPELALRLQEVAGGLAQPFRLFGHWAIRLRGFFGTNAGQLELFLGFGQRLLTRLAGGLPAA